MHESKLTRPQALDLLRRLRLREDAVALLDRLQRGRRWALAASSFGRAVLAAGMRKLVIQGG